MADQSRSRDRVTIYDIAALAGVHPSTVSRALSTTPTRRVTAETVAKIKSIADELGYEANPWAQSLRTQRTQTIGLVLPHFEDFTMGEVFEAATRTAFDSGYQSITVSTGDDPGRSSQAIRALVRRRVDGLVIASAHLEDPALDELRDQGIPYMLLNRVHRDDPCIRADDELGAYLAASHLIERGHRRVALLSGVAGASSAELRRDGFTRAFREATISLDPQLIQWSGLGIGSGIELGRRLLQLDEPPTAIFAANDFVALGVMSAARDLGRRVPDDLALVGYNDTEAGAALPIPLSSVSVPLRRMGEEAIRAVIGQIEGEAPRSDVYEPRLVVRASSDSWRA
ncbi:LacI family DNA-binding transcriptional regulator [Microbacterium soli]|uniref:LacI family DNA-binding transcriptional regulator n=1 Tax=Microbacterium soli TaxID=446075 RepID=A0ABP7NC80_9MICO